MSGSSGTFVRYLRPTEVKSPCRNRRRLRLAVARDDHCRVDLADPRQRGQPLPGIGFLDEGLDAVEDVVAGEQHALLRQVHPRLGRRMAGKVQALDGMPAQLERELIGEGM